MGALRALWAEYRWTIVALAVLAAGYLLLRSSPSPVASAEEFAEVVRGGEATVAYFYANT